MVRTAIVVLALLLTLPPAHGQLVREHDGQSLRSFHGATTRIRRSFQSDAEARAVLRQILAAAGLAGIEDRIILRASAETANAEAFIEKDERLIFYNAVFMQDLAKQTKDYWSMVAVLAHELGHHVRFHTAIPGRAHEFELEADYQAGFILRRLGATLEQAQGAFRAIGTETATATHPARAQRLQAVTLGWTDGGQSQTASWAQGPSPAPVQACSGVLVKNAYGQHCLEPGAGRRESFRDCDTCPEMVVVPAGTFMMGSPANEPERESDLGRPGARKGTESPQHQVTIAKPFAVSKSPVTRHEFEMFVVGSGHDIGNSCWTLESDRGAERSQRSFRNPGIPQGDDHPAVCVSWHDAKAYVESLSRLVGKRYRLLSESEREYVARAGSRTPFWWGSSISTRQANYNGAHAYAGGAKGEYRRTTVAVSRFDPNPWGLFNVHGNVWEWTEDCWNGSYSGAPEDGSAWKSAGCGQRVLRGGSWINHPGFLRAAMRVPYAADVRYNGAGFRVARTLD
jgi:formylglycine-generating enzyme required for sulfatase activity